MNIDTKSTLKKFNVHPSKSLGQNFLTDTAVLRGIVRKADVTKEDLVLEVGPGLGSLTAELAEHAGRVVAVEIDKRLVPILRENLKEYSNVSIVNADIMRIDPVSELQPYLAEPLALKVVANLPYYITTPVIMKLLESGMKAKTMVFMVQKEVADRMQAKPGGKDYGALTVAVQYYSKPAVVLEVPPQSFIPQPGVDSSVIRLDIYDVPPVELDDREMFFRVVKAAFGQRRKTLSNALNNAGAFQLSKDEIRGMLSGMGIDENRRGETLSLEQFAQLSNLISRRK